MKKMALLVLLFVTTISIAQEKEKKYPQDLNKKHELKLNAFNLIALSSVDVSYEYLINKDSSFGVGVFYNFNDADDILLREFSLTPYYRWFFSERFASRGFFVEMFGMLNANGDENSNFTRKETNFAIGISVGGKFVTTKNFVAEVYLGVGRNLINGKENILDSNIVGRGGISLGYRF